MHSYHVDADARTFHTDTFSGVMSAWTIAVAPVTIMAIGVYVLQKSQSWGIVLIMVAVVLFVMFVLPMWFAWLARLRYNVIRKRHESTHDIVAMNKEIDLEHARRATAESLAKMSNDQAKLAREWMLAPPIRILESSVVWEVDGVSVPITFTIEWLAKWEQRGAGRELPADRDWSGGDIHRDLKRSYNRAIRRALIRHSTVRDVSGGTGGPFPARFITNDVDSALGEIGFWMAHELAQITIEEK